MKNIPIEIWMKIISSITTTTTKNDLLKLRLINHQWNDIILRLIKPNFVYFRFITPGSKNFEQKLIKIDDKHDEDIHLKIFKNYWQKFYEFSKEFSIEHLCFENFEQPINRKSLLFNDDDGGDDDDDDNKIIRKQFEEIIENLKSIKFKNCLNFELLNFGWNNICKSIEHLQLINCFLINNNFHYNYFDEKIDTIRITTLDLRDSRLNDKIFFQITKHLTRLKRLNCSNTRMRFYFHLIRRSYLMLTTMKNIDFQPTTTYAFTFCSILYYLNQNSSCCLEEIQIGPLLNVENLIDLIGCKGSGNLRRIHLWLYELDFNEKQKNIEKNFQNFSKIQIEYHCLPSTDIRIKI